MWQMKRFEDLTSKELHAIYRLRVEVFVVEQACAYQEVDEADLISWHGMFWEDDQLLAYYRLIPREDGIHLGRVVVGKTARGRGLGRDLVVQAISEAKNLFGSQDLHAQAQAYLQNFYASFDFEPVSDIYLEDDIPHLDMVLKQR
ncbi:ElaA protein [Streptococcus rupicaprae]|uniref:ElaA protein n=1 Tax=Streptococcus rupicaprae TaxID=759619 RepID=A0ABV2FHA9_9STRE